MLNPRLAWLAVVVLMLASVPVHAQYTTADTLKAVAPGLVYKEYHRTISNWNNDWRVTDPNATFVGDPENSPSAFLPNPVLSISIDDLQGAVRAVAVIDAWGGHVGTIGKQFRLNESDWLNIPPIANSPSDPECYTHQSSVEVEVPIGDLVEGSNSLEGTSGGQTCFDFGWGQWGWYGVLLRVYYDPAQKTPPTGAIINPVTDGTIGANPTFEAVASSAAGISRVEFVGYYEDVDTDGDGIYLDWQQSYHRMLGDSTMKVRNHIGTAESAPYAVVWDNAWVPDQPAGEIKVVARIRDATGLWYVTDQVTDLTLSRPDVNVELYKATDVPTNYWVRGGSTKSSNFVIPAEHELVLAQSARMHAVTWNGSNAAALPDQDYGAQVNGWTTPRFGVDYYYSYDLVDIPLNILQNGTNTISFFSETNGHGAEVLWPGPGMTVRYFTYTSGPAVIVAQPENAAAIEGTTASFSVTAGGAEPLSYQWQRNGFDITGADGPSYTTPPVSETDDGDLYRCVVTNGQGTDTSDEATLTVVVLGPRITVGQIILYDFEEGSGDTINDISGVGQPVDLVIGNTGAVTWLPGALSVDASTVIASAGAVTKLSTAAMASNELTIEAWLKPANLTQNGPARIITYSTDIYGRNITLGQGIYGEASDLYEMRLRSTTTGLNGTPALATAAGDLTTQLTHVVFTRNLAGATKIYIDGVERASGNTFGDFSNWDDTFRLGLANEITGDRPWLGEFHLVALFDRALAQAEVLQNYASGPVQTPEINATVFPLQELGGPVTIFASFNGAGNSLAAAKIMNGEPGIPPETIDATIGIQLVDGFGDPIVGFPAENIYVMSQSGGWTLCPGFPLTADGPTDATGTTTISGVLVAGGHSGPGELLQVHVDDPQLVSTSYPGGLPGLEYRVNSADFTGDLKVDLPDVAQFAAYYFGGVYEFAADLAWDGAIDLPDVAKFASEYGRECPVPVSSTVARNNAVEALAGDTIGVVFDPAGASRARMLEPGEQIDAYLVLSGRAAEDGIAAFDVRIRASENVVVHQRNVIGNGLRLTDGDDFVVGYSARRRAQAARPLQLVHLRVSVTDRQPAYFWLEPSASSHQPLPTLVIEGDLQAVRPASGEVGMPVASLNDEDFALDGVNLPSPRLSLHIAPNPFNPLTKIGFSLPASGQVELRIFNARGQLVTTLRNEVMVAGEHEVTWNGTDRNGRHVAAGVYFSSLKTDAGTLLEKMALIK